MTRASDYKGVPVSAGQPARCAAELDDRQCTLDRGHRGEHATVEHHHSRSGSQPSFTVTRWAA